jgi:ABC-2 type transport system ATP-binding protein
MPSIVEAEDLTKVFNGNFTAVDHISFKVSEGEVFGFLGPNGAGKTTTIKMLTTLASITQGKAIVAGYNVATEQDKVRQSIGLVPQDLTIDDDLKGTENLLLAAKLYHVPDAVAKSRASELLGLVDLTDAANRLVSTYSGGMRKRLELIVGLIHQPKMLFLDEPTLGLDIQTRTVMWNYIKRLNEENEMTLFVTTHYLEEADSLCHSVAIIDHGKIRVSGSPGELKQRLGGDVLEIAVNDRADLTEFFYSVPGVKDVKKSDHTYRIKLPSTEEALPTIFEGISKKGLKITKVSFDKPSLDQVFLEVTGRSLRDQEQGAEDRVQRFIMRARSR